MDISSNNYECKCGAINETTAIYCPKCGDKFQKIRKMFYAYNFFSIFLIALCLIVLFFFNLVIDYDSLNDFSELFALVTTIIYILLLIYYIINTIKYIKTKQNKLLKNQLILGVIIFIYSLINYLLLKYTNVNTEDFGELFYACILYLFIPVLLFTLVLAYLSSRSLLTRQRN